MQSDILLHKLPWGELATHNFANNTRLHQNPQPNFLGATLDRLLTFGPHIQSTSTKAAARCVVFASLTSKE